MSLRGTPRRATPSRMFVAPLLLAAAVGGLLAVRRTAAETQQPPDDVVARAYLPMALLRGPGPSGFPVVPTVAPTSGPSATPPPTPLPTRDTRRVSYPTDPAIVVLQIGQSDTEQDGPAWEEMNGTPYLTVYGDGRVIAARRLHAAVETLYEARVDDALLQTWLVPITYDVQLFTLADRYDHPATDHFAAHLYLRFGPDETQFKRVSIGGLRNWLTGPLPEVADAERVRRLAERIVALDDFTSALDAPYAPQQYTAIAHEINGTGSAPRWPLALDVAAISDSAPLRPVDGHPHGPPGHRTLDAAVGDEARAVTVADAKRDFPGFNFAARYRAGSKYYVVGVRPEVPGGSLFLPQRLHEQWYRRDG